MYCLLWKVAATVQTLFCLCQLYSLYHPFVSPAVGSCTVADAVSPYVATCLLLNACECIGGMPLVVPTNKTCGSRHVSEKLRIVCNVGERIWKEKGESDSAQIQSRTSCLSCKSLATQPLRLLRLLVIISKLY